MPQNEPSSSAFGLAGVVFLALAGAVFIVYKQMHRSEDPQLSPEALRAFNADVIEQPKALPPLPLPSVERVPRVERVTATSGLPVERLEPVSAAPAAPSQGSARRSQPAAPSGPAADRPRPALPTPRNPSEEWAYLWKDPSGYMLRQTLLGSPAKFAVWLRDPKRIQNWFNNPLVKGALNSPTTMRLLLGNPSIAGAFLESPVMADPRSVEAVLASPVLQELFEKPGVQAMLADPSALAGLLADPRAAGWLGRNPSAMNAINARKGR